MAMNQSAARFLLKSAGRNLAGARESLDKRMEEAKREVILAHKHGVSVTEIARELGVTRQTIYTWMDEASKDK